jgi:hypothetical protein
MARAKTNRRIDIEITPEQHDLAVRSNSGGCLIADALKAQGFSGVVVDMATIRVSDKKAGKRYVYLTPPDAQHILLAFDQGWNVATATTVQLRKPVQVSPLKRGGGPGRTPAERAARIAELAAKVTDGTATGHEKSVLRRMQATPDRPTNHPPVELTASGIVTGGRPPVQGDPHPNLLRGRNHIFGAKLADPGVAFREAVAAERAIEVQAD